MLELGPVFMSYKHYNSQILTGVMLELGPVFMSYKHYNSQILTGVLLELGLVFMFQFLINIITLRS